MTLLAAANRLGLAFGFLGLVCGVVYSVGGFVVDLLTTGLNAGTAMAFGALLGMPLAFGAFGWACGLAIGLAGQGIRRLRDR